MPTGAELRDYLTVERTLLAWIRTGLALMGFAFLVAEGEQGKASISYNSPYYLQARHNFPVALLQNLAALEALAAQAAA